VLLPNRDSAVVLPNPPADNLQDLLAYEIERLS
jgi:hypothetical protein